MQQAALPGVADPPLPGHDPMEEEDIRPLSADQRRIRMDDGNPRLPAFGEDALGKQIVGDHRWHKAVPP